MEFIDLRTQQERLQPNIRERLDNVLAHGQFISGPEVGELEICLARFTGAGHAVSCANGTDAITLALRALGIGPDDTVIVPSFTFCATAEAVCLAGAIPYFADVEADSFNLCPESLECAIHAARSEGHSLKAVIAVDLFGRPCDYDRIEPIVRSENLYLICDAAQALGARYRGRNVGTFGDITTTSFFPAKPLGCYGDGGAIFTNDEEMAALLRSLRVHGQGADKYDNVRIGTNSRLDTIQAAILLEKLTIFPEEIERRNAVARRYAALAGDGLGIPEIPEDMISVWAQYTLRTPKRDALMASLRSAQIPSVIYYRKALHRQTAYAHFPRSPNGLPISEQLESEVMSLPMHPYLTETEQARIADVLHAAMAA